MSVDETASTSCRRVRRRRWMWAFGGFGILSLIVIVVGSIRSESDEHVLAAARAALADENSRQADELAKRYLRTHPDSAEALVIAGRSAWNLGRRQDAIDCLERVADENSPHHIDARRLTAEFALRLGQTSVAERSLRCILRHDPSDYEAIDKLVTILRIAGRNWEIAPFARELIRTGHYQIEYLLAVGLADTVWIFPDDMTLVERCVDANDFGVRLGFAREQLVANQYGAAQRILQEIVASDPLNLEAQARLGIVLLRSAPPLAFQQWHSTLPESADAHPEIWHARGLWAQQQQDHAGAARCFWECLLRYPHHSGANYQLSQSLVSLGRASDAEPFAQRAVQLAHLEYLIGAIPNDFAKVRPAAEVMESLGRHWEAIGWCEVALRQDSAADVPWASQSLKRLRAATSPTAQGTQATQVVSNPAEQIDLTGLPRPNLNRVAANRPRGQVRPSPETPVAFTDTAAAAGLDFSYYNGAEPNSGRARMFEFSGGGVAVLDFDGDGWSDVYLTQGCAWPPDPAQQQHRNQLFRNLGNGRFEDVTEPSGLGDNGFGQGVTVGDFNNDGFADVYVANIGTNRLYRNNGDGTFSDVTTESGISGEQWTVSCVLADFNGDTWPDLYDVNYLGGPEVFTRECQSNGKPIQCFPTDFPAEQDRMYLNQGNGTFKDITTQVGIVAPGGKGMGVVAADFDGSRRLSLFVANDTTANFFFANQTKQRGDDPVFKDRAVLSGLGFNDSGHADSCMGIAVGDANRDGLLDLFVTNFRDEANNFFVQRPGQLFDDLARPSRLREYGFLYEGWGTQFLDGELDGWPDLVVANGHLEDVDPNCKMSAQYYRNLGDNQFLNEPANRLGNYFQRAFLGRAVAISDWNRDGKEDFFVTHVDAPTALLTNQTSRPGHFVSVELRGVRSARDAIGATVRVTAGGQTWLRQLTAGDGFQASNQRQLVFGLGPVDHIDSVTVSWPEGDDQTFTDLEVDRAFVFTEGQPHANVIRR